MGLSYGGYSTLVGMTMTPNFFACGVTFAGISDVVHLVEGTPPAFIDYIAELKFRVGDHTTEEG